jgi:hypothetical protein
MSTYLTTQQLMTPQLEPDFIEGPAEYGWPGVRHGLHNILKGYLLALFLVLLVICSIGYIIWSVVTSNNMFETVLDAAMILYLTWGICIVGGLYSLILVISGKIHCVLNAPERCGAKWIMFGSILCFVFGPALNIVSNFVGVDSKRRPTNAKAAAMLMHDMRDFSESMVQLQPRAYLSLAGNLSSIASTALFVIFLRQVSRCFNDGPRMRLAEFYLIFNGLILAGSVWLFLRVITILRDVTLPVPGQQFALPPSVMRELNTLPLALALLGASYLLALVWYFGLIISTSKGIAQGLAVRRAALELSGGAISG